MMTLSGQHLTLEGGNPTLSDIAVGLSRLPRFAGQTVEPWTVAHHSLAVAQMAMLGRSNPFDELTLHCLLHDAHEMMTGDVPTTFKTPDLRALQAELDTRIYYTLGVPLPRPIQRAVVKCFDRCALLAEAYCVTPAATYERIAADAELQAEGIFIDVVHGLRGLPPEDAATRFEAAANVLIDKWGTA